MSILDILTEVGSDSGKIFKKETIEKYKDNALLKRVFQLTYNPNIVYRIKELPVIEDYIDEWILLEDTLDILDAIANREYSGQEAIDILLESMSKLVSDDEIVIRRIIDGSLKMGCGVSTVNKAIPKLIPTTPYMGATSFNEKKARKLFEGKKEVEIDVKMDGRYVNMITKNGDTTMVSRQGKNSYVPAPHVLHNAKFMSVFLTTNNAMSDGVVLNGELMMSGVERYEANGIIASIIKITEKELDGIDVTKDKEKFKKKHMDFDVAVSKIYVTIWDFIPFDNYMNDTPFLMPRKERLAILTKSMPVTNDYIRLVEHKIIKTYEEAIEWFNELINRGDEGAILKSLDGLWVNKKPTYQIKMKLEFTCDLKIVGLNEGSKGSKYEGTLGSFKCESSDGLLKCDPGGISDADRDSIWKNIATHLNTTIEVKCNGLSQDSRGAYSLMHPVYKCFRPDTTVDSLNDIKANQDMVLGLKDESESKATE